MTGLSKESKIQRAAEMLPLSSGFRANVVLSSVEWAGILKNLDESRIDELLLILEEESGMNSDNEREKDRKLTMNRSTYLQRLEKLKIRIEDLTRKSNA